MHIGHIRAQGCYLHCARAYPSYTGVHTVCVAPESTTSPVALPLASVKAGGKKDRRGDNFTTTALQHYATKIR